MSPPSGGADDSLSEKKSLGYTTVLKLLQIMTTKGTVRRNETQRAHVYEAVLPAEHTKRQLAGDMLQRVFLRPFGALRRQVDITRTVVPVT